MNVKMDVNLRTVQEQVEDNVQQVRTYSNKALFAYIGLWGLAYDYAKDAYTNSSTLFEKAEHRGEEMVRDLNDQLDRVQTQAGDQTKKVRNVVEEQVDTVSKTISANSEMMQKNANKVLSRVGISGADLAEEVTSTVIEVKSDLEDLVVPFKGYDDMTAKELTAKLDSAGKKTLKTARAYEAGTKNRVTVLRHIDDLLNEGEKAAA